MYIMKLLNIHLRKMTLSNGRKGQAARNRIIQIIFSGYTDQPKDTYTQIGHETSLMCSVIGDRIAVLTWWIKQPDKTEISRVRIHSFITLIDFIRSYRWML